MSGTIAVADGYELYTWRSAPLSILHWLHSEDPPATSGGADKSTRPLPQAVLTGPMLRGTRSLYYGGTNITRAGLNHSIRDLQIMIAWLGDHD
jgi:hypothetical protein